MSFSDQFLGQIRIFPFNFAPAGWLQCDGQLLPVSQNSALYAVLGNTYGGVQNTSFALPDLRSLCVLGVGQGTGSAYDYTLGETGGQYFVPLSIEQNAVHPHNLLAVSSIVGPGQTAAPSPTVALSRSLNATAYAPSGTAVQMDPTVISVSGSGSVVAHTNIMPLLGLNFCICTMDG